MRIHQIDIDNFKSFSGKTSIPFEDGFTTISGPNGSGKSNIIDSILFCLGLSSSRTMRAEKLTDLINNLSARREATVTITFGPDDKIKTPVNPDPDYVIDALVAEDKDSEATTQELEAAIPANLDDYLVISRRIKDNGASGYTSTYYLNGRTSTLGDVHDALSRHNVSPGSYNVLMQGDVTGIINMTAMERRKIIDEIAGVADFDRKIDQAEKELASVGGSIERFTILLDELANQKAQLSQERELALKYLKLKEEKTHAEGLRQCVELNDLRRALQTLEQNVAQARKDKTLAQKNLEQQEHQLTQVREELAQLAQEVKRKGEDQQIALQKQIESLKGAIARKNDAITFGQQKKVDNDQTGERCRSEIERLDVTIAELKEQVEKANTTTAELEAAITKERDALEALEQKMAEFHSAHGELTEQRMAKRQDLMDTDDKLAQENRHLADAQATMERLDREEAYVNQRLAESQGQSGQLIADKARLEKAVSAGELEFQAFQSQIQAQTRLVAQCRVDWQQTTAQLNEVHRQFVQCDAQRRALDEASLGRSVETVLRADIPGVHGTLSQLGDVDVEYAVALEIAMGNRVKSIVVDDDRVAQEGIDLLQSRKAGRATFLPLNKIKPPYPLKPLPNKPGLIDYAINLIEFDSQYDAIFAYALGDTVVVDDIKTARQHLNQFRMVTLDGSLMEKTGAMTGGSLNQATGKLASQKLDNTIATLKEQLETLDETLAKQEKQLSKEEIKLDQLKEDAVAHQSQLHRWQAEFEALQKTLGTMATPDHLEQEQATLKEQRVAAQAKQASAEAAIAELTTIREAIEAAIEAIDKELPTDWLDGIKGERDALESSLHALEGQLRQHQADIHARQLEREFHEKALSSYHEQLSKLDGANDLIDQERAGLESEIAEIQQQIDALVAQAGELDEELKQLQAKRDEVQAKLIDEERAKFELQKQVSSLEETLLAYDARKRELRQSLQELEARLVEAGFDIAPEAMPADLPSLEDLEKQIQKLTRQMDAMGAVNMKAIEAYDDVAQRHSELEEKIDTLNREQKDLTIKIQGYNELKRNAFLTAFDNVNAHFKEIFAELSDGEGQLILTNPTDPFSGGLTIEARPRGKKTLRLEAMSGGEKSLTALAFVFSFQRYMPAPFYAFDEVDMFLDGINAEKLAHMVQKQAAGIQFIVVSLRKPMLENSQRTVGVTQQKNGITKVTGVRLTHAS